ncbi:MAG: PEP-CTERM sorting domain-containing protein [Phycisphaeraceae bacterium]
MTNQNSLSIGVRPFRGTVMQMVAAMALMLFVASGAKAVPISLTGGAYTQDFDTLATAGSSSTLPPGWAFVETGGNANGLYVGNNGAQTAGDTYSYGTTGSTDRALGALRSGTLVPIIGAEFTNNTGGTITSLSINYIGEMWRAGVTGRNAADRIDFAFSLNATALNNGAFTDVDALDYQSSNINTTAGAVDGNSASFNTPVAGNVNGLNILNGSTFWIRWTDFDISSSDDGLAVDNFSLTPTFVLPPPLPALAPVLNEFVANHTGGDTHEFVEAFGLANTDYSRYTILQLEGDGTGAGTIDSVLNLGTTDANGIFVTSFFANELENGTLTLLLVQDFTGTDGTDLDTDNDGILDSTPWVSIVDSVGVMDADAGDFVYSSVVLDPAFAGGAFAPGGASRIPNGLDTDSVSDWVRNDFDGAGLPGFVGTPVVGEAINTPGALNSIVPVPEPASFALLLMSGAAILQRRRRSA